MTETNFDIWHAGAVTATKPTAFWRWRRCDLAQWPDEEFGVSVEESTVGRVLREMGYRKLTARPRHYNQNGDEVEAFEKASQSSWLRSARASGRA